MSTELPHNQRHTPPDQYFESFNERLLNRMKEEGIVTQPPNSLRLTWLKPAAIAASVALVAFSALLIFRSSDQPPKVAVDKGASSMPQASNLAIDNTQAAQTPEATQNQLISLINEDLKQPETSSQPISKPVTAEDKKISRELEDLGLTSGESGEELIGDIDI